MLAEAAGKRILLTGDALDVDIVDGLASAGLLDNGTCHVDVLKLPHHGSDRNVSAEFFAAVTADHYVVSGDGRHGNPEMHTLELLEASRGASDQYQVHLTYRDGKEQLGERLDAFLDGKPAGRYRFPRQRSPVIEGRSGHGGRVLVRFPDSARCHVPLPSGSMPPSWRSPRSSLGC